LNLLEKDFSKNITSSHFVLYVIFEGVVILFKLEIGADWIEIFCNCSLWKAVLNVRACTRIHILPETRVHFLAHTPTLMEPECGVALSLSSYKCGLFYSTGDKLNYQPWTRDDQNGSDFHGKTDLTFFILNKTEFIKELIFFGTVSECKKLIKIYGKSAVSQLPYFQDGVLNVHFCFNGFLVIFNRETKPVIHLLSIAH